MEKKFKNKVAFTGPTPLRKAMVEELLKIGYKWVAADKNDYEEYKYTKNFFVSIWQDMGLGNTGGYIGNALIFTLPEQWDECLKACSEVEEEEKPKLNEHFKKYVLKENNMKMEKFSIGGSLPLKKAFVEEGGFKVYDDYTLTEEWPLLTMLENGTIAGVTSVYPKHFELPKDWDAALEYVKLYFNQKEVKVFDLGNGYKAEVNLQGNTIKVEGKGIIKASDFVAWFDNNFSTEPIITTLSGYKCKLFLSVGCLEKVDLDIVNSIYNYISSNAQ